MPVSRVVKFEPSRGQGIGFEVEGCRLMCRSGFWAWSLGFSVEVLSVCKRKKRNLSTIRPK